MPLNEIAAARPDAVAVRMFRGASLTYAELEAQSAQLANHLRARGLRHGDRIGLLLENSLAYAVALWAARRAGLYAVPINWQLTVHEIGYIIADSDARALICSPAYVDLATEALGETELPVLLCDGPATGRFGALAEAIAACPADQPPGEPDGSPMYYSSGTTGRPKGIKRPQNSRYGEPRPIEQAFRRIYGLSERSVILLPAPLYFTAPNGWLLIGLVCGAEIVLMPRFEPETVLQAIDECGVTHVLFVPIHFVRLLRLPDEVRAAYDLGSLEMAVHVGASCPPEVKAAMLDWWGPRIHEYYSGSEGVGLTTIAPEEWRAKPGTVGRTAMGAIHILGDDGAELPPGEIGTIWFEDATPFQYHKAPEKTETVFNAQGWATLGDLGHLDEDGYLFIANRRTDLIISGGANIYPQEIENEIAPHPAVADVCAVGIPDAEYGQQVRLLVQLVPGARPGPELEGDLLAFCRSRLAGYKCPRSLLFVEALPRLANGKLLRRNLDPALLAPAAAPALARDPQ